MKTNKESWFTEEVANLLFCKVAEHKSEFLLIVHHACSSKDDGLITEHMTISSDLISTSECLESDGTATREKRARENYIYAIETARKRTSLRILKKINK